MHLDITVTGPTEAYCRKLAERAGKEFFEVEQVVVVMVNAIPNEEHATLDGEIMAYDVTYRVYSHREPPVHESLKPL